MSRRDLPEDELGEECVAVTCSKIVNERLRDVTRVLKEAEDSGEHLDKFQWRQFRSAARLLHIFNAQRDAALVCCFIK